MVQSDDDKGEHDEILKFVDTEVIIRCYECAKNMKKNC